MGPRSLPLLSSFMAIALQVSRQVYILAPFQFSLHFSSPQLLLAAILSWYKAGYLPWFSCSDQVFCRRVYSVAPEAENSASK
ncbi:hypothetical protein KCP76_13950 [Salmonella enterica subsp. enterica serovar Weltevreden]|nr:hypothetical protein KCP76_13950 [Salmonella enterica subsp. enterica serovar Weltevreden]